jgi:hypothetical protein
MVLPHWRRRPKSTADTGVSELHAGEFRAKRGVAPPRSERTAIRTGLDAKVPAGDVVVEGRGRLDDAAVLHMQLQCAADPKYGQFVSVIG